METHVYFYLQLTVGLKGEEGSQGPQGPPGRRVSTLMRTKGHVLLPRVPTGMSTEFKVRITGSSPDSASCYLGALGLVPGSLNFLLKWE